SAMDAVYTLSLHDALPIYAERGGDLGGGGDDGVDQDPGGRPLSGGLQVVVEAAQFQRAFDLAVHHLGADAAAPHQESLVDQGLDGLADGRPGQSEPGGELYLVAQEAAGGQCAVLDGRFELLGQLEVQRDGGTAVHAQL